MIVTNHVILESMATNAGRHAVVSTELSVTTSQVVALVPLATVGHCATSSVQKARTVTSVQASAVARMVEPAIPLMATASAPRDGPVLYVRTHALPASTERTAVSAADATMELSVTT